MENNLTKLGERNVPLCSLETRFRPNFGPIKGKADARKAEAGNPRIGGFPRSWVAPFNISPPSLSLPLNLCRGQTSISRGKRDGGRGAHYVSVIGRIQPCFQFAQRRRLCNSQKRADVLFEGTNNCSWFHKVGGFCARTATRNLLRDDVIDDRDNVHFEVENYPNVAISTFLTRRGIRSIREKGTFPFRCVE